MNNPQPTPVPLMDPLLPYRASRRSWKSESVGGRIRKLSFRLSAMTPILGMRGFYRHPIGSHYDMHFGLEFGVILSGRMRRYYRHHWRDVGPGQVWCCGMWEPHGCQVLKAPCECIVLVIWPPMLANLRFDEAPEVSWLAPFTIPPRQRPQIIPRMRTRMLKVGRQLKEILATKSSGRQLWLRLLFLEMLLILYEQWNFPQDLQSLPHADVFTRLNQALQKTFESHALVTTAQVARACGMSRETFSNLFVRWMGIRFSEFALRHRVNAAATHLAHTQEPIKSIARHWGFTDSSHLHRCFQKCYHCTPGAYRRRRCHRSTT